MLRFGKVATPLTAATVVVPARVPLAGLVPIATVMLVVAVITVLPWASWTATCIAGVIAPPAAALLGCTVKRSFAAAPTPMLNALLVAPVRPVADAISVYPVALLLRLNVENVATPFTAAIVVVPARVPLAGLVPIATVMLVVAVVTVLPWASWTATCTAGVIAAPAAALLGCTVKVTFAAAPLLNARWNVISAGSSRPVLPPAIVAVGVAFPLAPA